MIEEAHAHAEATRLVGAANAAVVEAVGKAEAERMRTKAAAYKQYGDAAITALVLEALPEASRPPSYAKLSSNCHRVIDEFLQDMNR